MTNLFLYGWSELHAEQYALRANKEFLPGRITNIKGFRYLLVTETGELEAELSGKLLYGVSAEDLPKVGDWVLFLRYDTLGYITEVIPRMNALTRRDPGTKAGQQVLACNIDTALIVQGVDRDFNLMRLDRYIVQVTACGIKPVVILNKSDLVKDADRYLKDVEALKRDCAVFLCSTFTGSGIEEIRSHVLEAYKTYILLGSSGVGKSSLLNALMHAPVQRIGSVSDFNSKGKHTTTARDLFRLDNGSLVIDNPGMREFGLTASEGSISADSFPEISRLSEGCRFNDCKHMGEKACAVIAAVQAGDLDETLYTSYLKLMKEQKRFQTDAAEKKKLGRQMSKMVREAKDYRNRFKGG